ncbi:hypothetical protein SAMN05877842_1189 [Ureibacillus acetophenoni]|uniref:Uncharacterized protein n=1 Tax=Ureibacillus acetophenoni TaxID=614649 RepID=A0A285UUN4_9BACL|nr:hypothetical protein SAMN05877842_1189 [Ureibacillus acetophenoni]
MYDKDLIRFVKSLNIPFKVIECPNRRWRQKTYHYLMA